MDGNMERATCLTRARNGEDEECYRVEESVCDERNIVLTSFTCFRRNIGRGIHARRGYASRGECAAFEEDIDGSHRLI